MGILDNNLTAGGYVVGPVSRIPADQPVGMPVVLFGDSIGGQRNFYFRTMSAGELVRQGQFIFANYTHGITQGETMRIATREPSGRFRAGVQRPTVISSTSLRFVADLPGADGTNPAGTANQCNIQNMSRYCAVGSWAATMAMMPSFGGRFEVEDSLANGGDNYDGLLVQRPFLLARATQLAARGGVMVGSFGSVPPQWSDTTGQPLIDVVREILRTGVRVLNIEAHATQVSGTTATQRRDGQNMRRWCHLLQEEWPTFRFVDIPTLTANTLDVDGRAVSGIHVDNVHYNQRGRLLVGNYMGSVAADWLPTVGRRMRTGRADGISSGTALLAENIATGLWNLTGSADTTLTAASGLVSGGATANGNTDPHVRLIGGASVTFNCFTEVTSDGRRLAGFDVIFGGAATAEIAMVGPSAAPYFGRIAAGHEYEVALDYFIGGIPGQAGPVNIQYADIVSDAGNGTAAMGGMDSSSPEFLGFLSTSTITDSFGGVMYWPRPVVIPSGLSAFRPHVVKLTSNAAGSVRVVLNDHAARRIV